MDILPDFFKIIAFPGGISFIEFNLTSKTV